MNLNRYRLGLSILSGLVLTLCTASVRSQTFPDPLDNPRLQQALTEADAVRNQAIGQTYVVTDPSDLADTNLGDGIFYPPTFRAAVENANLDPDMDLIEFDPTWTSFQPGGDYTPSINTPVYLTGVRTDSSRLIVDGSQRTTGRFVAISSGGCIVTGFDIRDFPSVGIQLSFNGGNMSIVENCVIQGCGNAAINFNFGTNYMIGGPEEVHRNYVFGNRYGMNIIANSSGNVIINNFIGTPDGSTADGNEVYGIQIETGNNLVTMNLIAGNLDDALSIDGFSIGGNVIEHNAFGLTEAQFAVPRQALPNDGNNIAVLSGRGDTIRYNEICASGRKGIGISREGIELHIHDNLIGVHFDPFGPGGDLVVEGNSQEGISVSGGDALIEYNIFGGNSSGVNISGHALVRANLFGIGENLEDVGNRGDDVRINSSQPGIVIGGENLADANYMFNSHGDGVNISGRNTIGALVQNNIIANCDGSGVRFDFSPQDCEVRENYIYSCGEDGIRLEPFRGFMPVAPYRNRILGNYIGIDESNSAADAVIVGNGIFIDSGVGNIIGSVDAPNYIVKCAGDGINMRFADSTEIIGNFIGRAPGILTSGNIGSGIVASRSSDLRIGSPDPFGGNVIIGNLGTGIILQDSSLYAQVVGNYIGYDPDNDEVVGNGIGTDGVFIREYADSALIGGGADSGNVIVGSDASGIKCVNTRSHRIFGNLIGILTDTTRSAPNHEHGIFLDDASNCWIGDGEPEHGNIISGNEHAGIMIRELAFSADSNMVLGNIIGLGPDTLGVVDNETGVVIRGGSYNVIGGTEESRRNIISGNDINVLMDSAAMHNYVINNIIGPDIHGGELLEEGFLGDSILISSQGVFINDGADSNRIGGAADSGNIVSGNRVGIAVTRSQGNSAAGNVVGLGFDSLTVLANYKGVVVTQATGNAIGGPKAGERNIISGNATGVLIDSNSMYNHVINNIIGLDAAGMPVVEIDSVGDSSPLAEWGIRIEEGADSNFVGGQADSGNVISGNNVGIGVSGSDYAMISGNFIGTDSTGMENRGNFADGIFIAGSRGSIVGRYDPGGEQALRGEKNIISGNGANGIWLFGLVDTTNGNQINGNLIGVGADTVKPLPNLRGVSIDYALNTYLGAKAGPGALELGNDIRENKRTGVLIYSDSCYLRSNRIIHNGHVEVPEFGDAFGDGVYISGSDNFINGINSSDGNWIEDNNGAGIFVDVDSLYGSYFNRLGQNNISGNVEGGIDLAPEGPDPRDALDVDDGPNDALNSPGPFTATVVQPGNRLLVKGVYSGLPNTTFRIDVYASEECDSLGLGQGEDYLSSVEVTTDAGGVALLDINLGPSAEPILPVITLSATDLGTGNSSEFSECSEQLPPFIELSVSVDDETDTVMTTEELTYDLIVANNGIDTATTVVLVDTLPTGVTYLSDTTDVGNCTFEDSVLTCLLGTMLPDDTARVTMTVRVDSVGWIRNTARVGAAEPDPLLINNVDTDSTYGSDVATEVETDQPADLPKRFDLRQNYPNPFNPATRISFDLPVAAEVRLEIYNVLGRRVALLHEGRLPAGRHTALWEADNFASGVYLYRLTAGDYVRTRKMVLLK